MSAIGTPPEESVSSHPAMACSHARAMRAAPKGYYSRLFPKPAKPIAAEDEEKLIELGNAMRYEVEREGTLTPRVGYTYFGQFLGHDLTHDPTPLGGLIPTRKRRRISGLPLSILITFMAEGRKSRPTFTREKRAPRLLRSEPPHRRAIFAICRCNMDAFS